MIKDKYFGSYIRSSGSKRNEYFNMISGVTRTGRYTGNLDPGILRAILFIDINQDAGQTFHYSRILYGSGIPTAKTGGRDQF